MNQLFQTPAQVEKVETRSDNSYKLIISTPELAPNEAATLFGLKNKQGWLLFKENAISESEVPTEAPVDFKADKSPSSRLRNVLFVYWKGKVKIPDFNTFYNRWIDYKIEEIKGKINE